jgi:hypothetical protein
VCGEKLAGTLRGRKFGCMKRVPNKCLDLCRVLKKVILAKGEADGRCRGGESKMCHTSASET